ncbi:helix-turn-helix transcriptional regulator [Roseomonas gilardii]|uniref:helix-turn-helix transcriptional regulator n=1 Tax=Roseomonas gilardii TaxID=257708 RepID=UPI0005633529|nr:helix-turn-helix transcriptional regulator [Roseomonas gilardii]
MLRQHRAIAAARVLAGMSQSELAKAASVSLSVLAAIEQGTSDPRNSTLLAIADVLARHGVRILGEDDRILAGVVLERGSDVPPKAKGRRKAPPAEPVS